MGLHWREVVDRLGVESYAAERHAICLGHEIVGEPTQAQRQRIHVERERYRRASDVLADLALALLSEHAEGRRR